MILIVGVLFIVVLLYCCLAIVSETDDRDVSMFSGEWREEDGERDRSETDVHRDL